MGLPTSKAKFPTKKPGVILDLARINGMNTLNTAIAYDGSELTKVELCAS